MIRLKAREKGVSTKKLSSQTGVEEKYCEYLENGNFDQLPADIYVRGYLFKIANFLDLDLEVLWSKYKEEKEKGDFSTKIPYLSKTKIKKTNYFQLGFLFSIFLVSLVFVFYQFSTLFLPPRIEIFYPSFDMVVSSSSIEIKGKTDASLITINSKKVSVAKNGEFDFNLSLLPGLNIVKIEAQNQIGKKTIIERKILYQNGG